MPHPRHVLLVDDDAAMRELLVYLIARTYVDVTIAEAATGAEALSAVTAQPPDLIISDCHMPVMDGLQLVRTLRSQGATMPILMLSSEPSIAKATQLAGATAFLIKPLAIRSFSQFLHTLLPDDTETRVLGQ
jgi:CheY-like chemotaxis protein